MSLLLLKAQGKGGGKRAPATSSDDPKDFLKNDLADLLAKPAAKAAAKPAAAAKGLANQNFVALLALLKEHGAGAKFGPHNVSPGDEIAFSAGEFAGSGLVSAAGEHGATVADKTDREHRVHWHEVTGHKPAAGSKGKKKGGADGV